ncbi:anti-sigma factor [Noviherbaspirillum saxi]|nr:anti-sigma factor [Noviherbaspirillum saxi]
MNFSDSNEMQILAGEYALGVMPPEEKSVFESELRRNPSLAAAVADWNDRLLVLSPPSKPVEPSTGLWQRIERDLPRKTSSHRGDGIWSSLSFWRISSMGGMIASAVLALSLLTMQPDSRAPTYVAVLQGSDAAASWIVEINDQTLRLRPLTKTSVPAGKSLQFWTKPEGAAGPTSLGLVMPDQSTVLSVRLLPGISTNQLFEVTLEPESGSPVNRPTGPILALGKAVPL